MTVKAKPYNCLLLQAVAHEKGTAMQPYRRYLLPNTDVVCAACCLGLRLRLSGFTRLNASSWRVASNRCSVDVLLSSMIDIRAI